MHFDYMNSARITSLLSTKLSLWDELRQTVLDEIRNVRSRFAGIRDPALHFIMRMLWPQPVGHIASNYCNFTYEFGGKYYLQYYMPDNCFNSRYFIPKSPGEVGAREFVPGTLSPFSSACGKDGRTSIHNRIVICKHANTVEMLGRLPDNIVTISSYIYRWYSIDTFGVIREFTQDDLLPIR